MTVAQVPTTVRSTAIDATEPPALVEPAPVRRHLLPRSDGSRYRQLTLALGASGDLNLTDHEMGAGPEAAWGADDNEVSLSVPPRALAHLAFALLAEHLDGRADGLEQLQALCERHGVDHRLACWT